jgi:hypothetical protein
VLSGHCQGLELAELTAMLPRPWRGQCREIELTELRVEGRQPVAIRFHGELTGVSLGDVLAPWGLGDVGGEVDLHVRNAELSRHGIEELVARGSCRGVALESATGAIGLGRMSGELGVVIDNLHVVDNHLNELHAILRVADAWDPPNWIEMALVREVVRRVLHFDLPSMLPPRVEYTRLGVRTEIHDEVLRIHGTHGDGDRGILSVRLWGQDWTLLGVDESGHLVVRVGTTFRAADSFDLRPALDDLRRRAFEALREPLAELERRAGGPPHSSAENPGPRPE